MLANIFNPVQLIIVGAILLILFGPQKLPEMMGQLGRALRELRRSTQELTNSFSLDDNDPYRPSYDPPRYDEYNSNTSYNTSTDYGGSSGGYDSSTGNSYGSSSYNNSSYTTSGAASSGGPRGDFAAAAFADDTTTLAPAPVAPKPGAPANTVPRDGVA